MMSCHLTGLGFLFVASSVLGCAGGAVSDATSAESSGSTGGNENGSGGRPNGLPTVEMIAIPMRPIDRGELFATPMLSEGPQPRLRFAAALTLAVGEGYPSRYLASLPSTWFGGCGLGSGVMRIETLEVTAGSGSVSRVDAQTLQIDVADPTVLSIVAQGDVTLTEDTCGHAAGTVLGLDVAVSVSAKEIAGSRVRGPCRDPILVAPRSQRAATISGGWFSAVLVDVDGEDFVAGNADAEAQVSVELFGAFEAEDAEPTSLGTWVAPPQPGLVAIETAFGDPVDVEVVDASQITGGTVEFQMAGVAATARTLMSGETYELDWSVTGNRLAPMLQALTVGEEELCSEPNPWWFELQTTTPSVCAVVDLLADAEDVFSLRGSRMGRAGYLVADGECRLELWAPDFDSAASFPRKFSASFTKVDELIEWE